MTRLLLAGLLALAATASAHAQQTPRPPAFTRPEILARPMRVMSVAPSWPDTNGWKLVPELTIQPRDGDPGELAKPSTVLRTGAGQFVISDWQTPWIGLFDRTGKFVRQLGRAGEGPGEYRQPFVALHRDTLVIQDPRLGRVTLMNLDGKVLRNFPIPANTCCQPLEIDARGRIRIPSSRGSSLWYLYDLATGWVKDSLFLPVAAAPKVWTIAGVRYPVPLSPVNVHHLRRDGSLIYGSTGTAEFHLTRNGRDTVMSFGRYGLVGAPVSDRLRDSLFHLVTDRSGAVRAAASAGDIPRSYPLWVDLREDGDGNTWVLLDSYVPGARRFDVYDRAGRWLGAVPIPWQGGTMTFLGDRVAVTGSDANDLPLVRIYRIDRRGR